MYEKASKTYQPMDIMIQRAQENAQRKAYVNEAVRNMHKSYDHVSLDR